jgi:hypothetical protein
MPALWGSRADDPKHKRLSRLDRAGPRPGRERRILSDPGFLVLGRSAAKPPWQGRAGMQVPKFVPPMGGLVALAIAACAGDSAVVDNLLIMPSHFDTLQCSELVGQFQSASQRLYELTMLREKAGAVAPARLVLAGPFLVGTDPNLPPSRAKIAPTPAFHVKSSKSNICC